MEKAKEISRSQFMKYFGKLQAILRDYRKYEEGYYLTDVSIEDVSATGEIRVEFTVNYGPVASYFGTDDVTADLIECKYAYIYGKDGKHRDCEEDQNRFMYRFQPRHCDVPSIEDFPDPADTDEDNLFEIISCIILKCTGCKKLLHSINFCSTGMDWSYDFNPGTPSTGEDGGEAPELISHVDGICLKSELTDDLKYSFRLVPSKKVSGEYDLYFYVGKKLE